MEYTALEKNVKEYVEELKEEGDGTIEEYI